MMTPFKKMHTENNDDCVQFDKHPTNKKLRRDGCGELRGVAQGLFGRGESSSAQPELHRFNRHSAGISPPEKHPATAGIHHVFT